MGLRSRMKRKAKLFPGKYDASVKGAYRSIRDFDDKVTAPHFGYKDAQDYYTNASSAQFAANISVPTLVIHSKDDPFIVMLPETQESFRANPNVRLIETEHGGHCAFIAEANGYDGRWAERRAIEFLQSQNEMRS
jgi:predicted alpha/beta-fold hydrolase